MVDDLSLWKELTRYTTVYNKEVNLNLFNAFLILNAKKFDNLNDHERLNLKESRFV